MGSLAYKKLNEETNHFLRLIVKKLPLCEQRFLKFTPYYI
nr:MAG TPA: hypothetical protein [Caudoviricetes sp.]